MKIVDSFLDPYSIVVDSDNYTVGIEKEYTKPDGEKNTVHQNQTFHSSIEGAIKKIITAKISSNDETVDLAEFLSKFQKMNSQLMEKFSNLRKLPKTEEDASL